MFGSAEKGQTGLLGSPEGFGGGGGGDAVAAVADDADIGRPLRAGGGGSPNARSLSWRPWSARLATVPSLAPRGAAVRALGAKANGEARSALDWLKRASWFCGVALGVYGCDTRAGQQRRQQRARANHARQTVVIRMIQTLLRRPAVVRAQAGVSVLTRQAMPLRRVAPRARARRRHAVKALPNLGHAEIEIVQQALRVHLACVPGECTVPSDRAHTNILGSYFMAQGVRDSPSASPVPYTEV